MMTLFIATSLYGQQNKTAPTIPQPKQVAEAPPPQAGIRYESHARRDPFLNLLLLRQQESKSDGEEPRGQAPPGIAGMYIAQVMLLGISTSEEQRTAIFRGTDKRAYFLHDGDRLFDGYVKNVGMDEVTMVRETKYRSGKESAQEVTKRLRTP